MEAESNTCWKPDRMPPAEVPQDDQGVGTVKDHEERRVPFRVYENVRSIVHQVGECRVQIVGTEGEANEQSNLPNPN